MQLEPTNTPVDQQTARQLSRHKRIDDIRQAMQRCANKLTSVECTAFVMECLTHDTEAEYKVTIRRKKNAPPGSFDLVMSCCQKTHPRSLATYKDLQGA